MTMRLLYAVQRYGQEVAGGAEVACRTFAEHLAARSHHVEVVTSCALSYTDWSDHYEPGRHLVNGVAVHRLGVERPRDPARFNALSAMVTSGGPTPLHVLRKWADEQGPTLNGYRRWMRTNARRFDVVAFYTYLYQTTTDGIAAAASRTATLLHPAAHHEWPLYLPIYDTIVRQADGFSFHTPEEGDLVGARFGLHEVTSDAPGLGLDDVPATTDAAAFRRQFSLGQRPYAIVLGRVDPNKGTPEAIEYFLAYKRRHPGPLALLVMGDVVHTMPAHPDVVMTGFVDDMTKHAALANAQVLIQPSYLESFSIVLLEAWQHQTPALVQRACDVLDGQTRRAAAGLAYRGFAEFEAMLQALTASPRLREALGRSGASYVRDHYSWPVVIDRYEALLRGTAEQGRRRLGLGARA